MASRIYLKLGDIAGPSTDEDHSDWIEIDSFSYGVVNSINCVEKIQGNPGGEACTHMNVDLNKIIDKTSPQLYAHCSLGSMWAEATVEVFEEKEVLFKVVLNNVAVSSISVSGGADGVPYENLSLAYTKINWTYKAEPDQEFDLATQASSLDKAKV